MKCQKQSLDYCDMINQFLEESTKRSTTMTLLKSAGGRSSTTLRNMWTLVKGGGAKKRFQYCVNPNSHNQFLYLRAIQGHSGSTINPALQDKKSVTRSFYRVYSSRRKPLTRNLRTPADEGNAGDWSEKDSDGTSSTDGEADTKRKQRRLEQSSQGLARAVPTIMPYKNTRKRFQNTVLWYKLELAQERALQFYQTRSHAVVLCNTQPAACIENAVCMKTKDEPQQKIRLTPRVPRVLLKSNSQYGQQDLQSQDARSSWDPPSDVKSYGETWNNAVDYRIPGRPLSSVKQQDTTRENKVKKLIEKFETTRIKNRSFRTWDRRRRSTSSAENRRIWSPTWTTPRSSNFAKILSNYSVLTAMPTGNLWQLWEKYEVCAKSNEVRPEQPWCHLNPWIRDQEEQKPLSQSPSFWKTKDVLPYEANAWECPTRKTRKAILQCRRRIQKVTVSHRVERTPHNFVRQDRPGEAHLHRYKSWKN